VLVIEHNLDVIKTADWIIDLGPEGGAAGGEIIAAGTPEDVAKVARSYTGQHVKPLLERARRKPATNGGGGSAKSARRERRADLEASA
jgi:excinuclease ABC subunit A